MKIHNKIARSTKIILAVGLMITLAACHEEFTLHDANMAIVGKGSIETDANFPSPIAATVNGKNFSGTWSATKVYEPDMAKMHRHISSRSYNEYMRGDSEHQLSHGQANLTAQDGSKLECDFYYRARPESGDCKTDGINLTVKFSEGTH